MTGVNFGRLDVKAASLEALKKGEFKLLEINGAKAEPVRTVPIMEQGRAALEKINEEKGLGFDEFDLDYYTKLFKVSSTQSGGLILSGSFCQPPHYLYYDLRLFRRDLVGIPPMWNVLIWVSRTQSILATGSLVEKW